MTQHYTTTGIGLVEAWPSYDRGGESRIDTPGYSVKHDDGSTYWLPKERFEAAYLPLGHIGSEPGYLQRMRAEYAQVEHRLSKLLAYMDSREFGELPNDPRDMLAQQANLMRAYANKLFERITYAANSLPRPS